MRWAVLFYGVCSYGVTADFKFVSRSIMISKAVLICVIMEL